MSETGPDQQVIQYLWERLGSRTSDITTFVPRGMIPELLELMPESGDVLSEDAVISYLEGMTQRNGGVYEMADGGRYRISMETRADWPPGHLGFRVSPA